MLAEYNQLLASYNPANPKSYYSLSHTTPPPPPPSPSDLLVVTRLFQSVIGLCIASGMVQSILTVDLVFDHGVLHPLESLGVAVRRDLSVDASFAYYVSILNSRYMTFMTLLAMFTVIIAGYQSFVGSQAVDHQFGGKGPYRVGWRFKILFWEYLLMVGLYLVFIIPKYLRFFDELDPNGQVLYRASIFDGWKTVLITRYLITMVNVNICFSLYRLIPVVIQIAYYKNRTGVTIDFSKFHRIKAE